jgi:hypothetical protein
VSVVGRVMDLETGSYGPSPIGRRSSVPRLAVAATAMVLAAGPADAAAGDFRRIPPDIAAAAQRTGPVRVIVKVAQPPGAPVDRAQDVVLGELTGTASRVLHRYLNSPFLALEVGEDALHVLDRSPNVLSVAGDFDVHPRSPGVRR